MKRKYPAVQAPAAAPVTLDFVADLGGLAQPAGVIHNLGETELQAVLTLAGRSTAPLVLPPGTRYLTPCALASVTLSSDEGEFEYQVVVES